MSLTEVLDSRPVQPVKAAKTVLIVDDDDDFLKTIALLFQMVGYKVLTASSGPAALMMLRRHRNIDVLFTDIVMPRMDGIELAQAALAVQSRIKVGMTSVFPDYYLRSNGKDFGDFPFLEKPYGMEEIKSFIDSL